MIPGPIWGSLFGSIAGDYVVFKFLIMAGIGLWIISILLPSKKKK